MWSEKTALCSSDVRLVRGCAWPRKEAWPGRGQKMAQFPQHSQLSLCQSTQRRQQLPLEKTKWDSWPSQWPHLQLSDLEYNSLPKVRLSHVKCFPTPIPTTRLAPRASQRDAGSNTEPLVDWVGLRPLSDPAPGWPGRAGGRERSGGGWCYKTRQWWGREGSWPSRWPRRAHPESRERSESPRKPRTFRQRQGQETFQHPGIKRSGAGSQCSCLGTSGGNSGPGARESEHQDTQAYLLQKSHLTVK